MTTKVKIEWEEQLIKPTYEPSDNVEFFLPGSIVGSVNYDSRDNTFKAYIIYDTDVDMFEFHTETQKEAQDACEEFINDLYQAVLSFPTEEVQDGSTS